MSTENSSEETLSRMMERLELSSFTPAIEMLGGLEVLVPLQKEVILPMLANAGLGIRARYKLAAECVRLRVYQTGGTSREVSPSSVTSSRSGEGLEPIVAPPLRTIDTRSVSAPTSPARKLSPEAGVQFPISRSPDSPKSDRPSSSAPNSPTTKPRVKEVGFPAQLGPLLTLPVAKGAAASKRGRAASESEKVVVVIPECEPEDDHPRRKAQTPYKPTPFDSCDALSDDDADQMARTAPILPSQVAGSASRDSGDMNTSGELSNKALNLSVTTGLNLLLEQQAERSPTSEQPPRTLRRDAFKSSMATSDTNLSESSAESDRDPRQFIYFPEREFMSQPSSGRSPAKSALKESKQRAQIRESQENIKILICDDSEMNRKMTTRLLEKLGYTNCHAVGSGAEAIAFNDANKPDMILLDVNMPEMDGFETCQRLRGSTHPAVIIVALTGAVSAEDIARLDRSEMDGRLLKPVVADNLGGMVRQFFETSLATVTGESVAQVRDRVLKSQSNRKISMEDTMPHILIVDDNAMNVTFMKRMCQLMNAATLDACNGKVAFDLWMEHRTKIKLILMDIEMPIMDGIKLCKLIRQREARFNLPPTAIVAVTAYVDEETERNIDEAGANSFLKRPLKQDELKECFQKVLGAPADVPFDFKEFFSTTSTPPVV